MIVSKIMNELPNICASAHGVALRAHVPLAIDGRNGDNGHLGTCRPHLLADRFISGGRCRSGCRLSCGLRESIATDHGGVAWPPNAAFSTVRILGRVATYATAANFITPSQRSEQPLPLGGHVTNETTAPRLGVSGAWRRHGRIGAGVRRRRRQRRQRGLPRARPVGWNKGVHRPRGDHRSRRLQADVRFRSVMVPSGGTRRKPLTKPTPERREAAGSIGHQAISIIQFVMKPPRTVRGGARGPRRRGGGGTSTRSWAAPAQVAAAAAAAAAAEAAAAEAAGWETHCPSSHGDATARSRAARSAPGSGGPRSARTFLDDGVCGAASTWCAYPIRHRAAVGPCINGRGRRPAESSRHRSACTT